MHGQATSILFPLVSAMQEGISWHRVQLRVTLSAIWYQLVAIT